MKKNTVKAILITLIFIYGCLIKKKDLYPDVQLFEMYSYQHLDKMMENGLIIEGESVIKLDYRKKIKSIKDIKVEDIQFIKETVFIKSSKKIGFVYCRDTSVNPDASYYDNINEKELLYFWAHWREPRKRFNDL